MEQVGGERSGSTRTRVGERLAAERHAQGMKLEDIALRTRVPLRALQTIEAGSTEGLPALTYTAGFVRSFADALGLDGAEHARQFRAEMGSVPQAPLPQAYELADPARVPSRLLAIVAIVVALLIAGGYAIWRGDGLFGGGAEERARLAAGTQVPPPGAVAPATLPGPQALAPPAGLVPVPPATGPLTGRVTITATQPVWLKVYERAGGTLFLGTMTAGQRFEVPANAIDPLIRTGRAQAIAVTVGSVAMAPLGPPETLVKDRSLKPAALTPASGAPAAAPVAGSAGAPDVVPAAPRP